MSNTKIPDDDQRVWNEFLVNPSKYSEQDNEASSISSQMIQIDLHYMSLEEAYKKIINIIAFAKDRNIKRVSIITGVGRHLNNNIEEFGKLYIQVPKWLEVLRERGDIYQYVRKQNNLGEIVVVVDK